jgi:hypothetical protein
MQDQEKIFARSVTDQCVPAVCDRMLPPSGTDVKTTKLLLAAMFVEIDTIEAPESLLQFGEKFEV